MKVPFAPEPIEALRDRFPLALARVYRVQAVLAQDGGQPSQLREHVFDFPHGVRMIVSIDRLCIDAPRPRFPARFCLRERKRRKHQC